MWLYVDRGHVLHTPHTYVTHTGSTGHYSPSLPWLLMCEALLALRASGLPVGGAPSAPGVPDMPNQEPQPLNMLLAESTAAAAAGMSSSACWWMTSQLGFPLMVWTWRGLPSCDSVNAWWAASVCSCRHCFRRANWGVSRCCKASVLQ